MHHNAAIEMKLNCASKRKRHTRGLLADICDVIADAGKVKGETRGLDV